MLKKRFAWRAWVAMLLAVVMAACMLPVAAEQEAADAAAVPAAETAAAPQPNGLVLMYKTAQKLTKPAESNIAYAKREADVRTLLPLLLSPLALDALSDDRSVSLLSVNSQTIQTEEVDGQTLQALMQKMAEDGFGGNNTLQSGLGKNFEALMNKDHSAMMNGAKDLWLVQGYAMFAVMAKDGVLNSAEITTTLNSLIKLLETYPALTVNMVWYGQEELAVDRTLLDKAAIDAYFANAGKADLSARVNVYTIDPQKMNAGISNDVTAPVGLVRSALEMQVPAPVVMAAKGEDGVFMADYVHVNDNDAWLHIAADGAPLEHVQVIMAANPEAECPVVHAGNQAWALVKGVKAGEMLHVRAFTAAEAVQVQGYAAAEAFVPTFEQTGIDILQNDNAQFTLNLHTNHVKLADLQVNVYAVDSQGVSYQPTTSISERTQNDTVYLDIGTSGLQVGAGNIHVALSFKDAMNQYRIPTAAIPYKVTSRAPEFNETATDSWAVYTDLEGKPNRRMELALTNLFSDPEGETLSFQAQSNRYWQLAGDKLVFLNDAFVEGEHQVTVTAVDPHGMEVSHTFTATQKNATDMMKAWRFVAEGGNAQSGALESVKTIALTLTDARAELEALISQYGITGPFEELITVTATMIADNRETVVDTTSGAAENGFGVAYVPAQEDGQVCLEIVLPRQVSEKTVTVELYAEFVENGMPLPELLPTITVEYGNTMPQMVADQASQEASQQVDDLMGKAVTLTLDELFDGSITPDELFTDAETPESLCYTLTISGGAAGLYAGDALRTPDSTQEDGTAVYELAAGQGGEPLDVRFTKAGDTTIVLSAKDSGGLQAENSVTWTVSLSSLHQMVMLIAIIAAAVIAILIVIIIIIRIRTRPHLRGTQLYLSTPDGGQTALKLGYWDKHAVSLASVAIAAKLTPITLLPIERLAQITIAPARGKSRRFQMKGTGEAESLAVRVNGTPANLRKGFYMEFGQAVHIYDRNVELLTLCIQRESASEPIL